MPALTTWLVAGGILAGLAGLAWMGNTYRTHKELKQTSREEKRRLREEGYPITAEVHETPDFQRGAVLAVGGLVLLGVAVIPFGSSGPATSPTDTSASAATVDAGDWAMVHYVVKDTDGTVLATSAASPGASSDSSGNLTQLTQQAAPVLTYAGDERPAKAPKGLDAAPVDALVPGVRDALEGYEKGDVFTVGPLSPSAAYGTVNASLRIEKPLTLTLERNQTIAPDRVAEGQAPYDSGENVTVRLASDARLPATILDADNDTLQVRLALQDGARVPMAFWNATAEVDQDTVLLHQDLEEGQTYGPEGARFHVTQVTDDTYIQDWNHPLAGQSLVFEVLVDEVPATPRERSKPTLPELELPAMNGETFRLSDHRGKVVLVEGFGAWCSSCKISAREIDKIAPAYEATGNVEFVSVDFSPDVDTWSDVREFKRIYGGPYMTYTMDDGTFTRQWRGTMDYTYIVMPDGTLFWMDKRVTPASTLDTQLDKALNKAGLEGPGDA